MFSIMRPADRLYRSFHRKFRMNEGRNSQVILLDDRKLEIPVQPKLYAGELLDIVASHFNLKEKEYFGLAYQDHTGHHHWLQLDRKVLDHDFTFGQHKKQQNNGTNQPITLYFMVKFYVETIIQLRDNSTIELFYLQAKQQVFKGVIDVDSETAFQLAAIVLQATHGDYIDDITSRVHLKKLFVIPTSVLKEHPSLSYCQDEILNRYKKLSGLSRGQCVVNYMTVAELLPTYGVHYFEVKDKGSIPWWLGLSHKGVSQYDYIDKKNPRRVFQWKQLENIYFRDKKFSIEVHDQKRVVHALSSFNLYEDAIEEPVDAVDDLSDAISDPTTQVSVSRRTFGPGNVTVYVWFAQTSAITKCIWSMAISQHQFYLDIKHSKSRLVNSKRSFSQIALELSRSCPSLSPASSTSSLLSLSSSTHSLCFTKIEEVEEQSEEVKEAQKEMLSALKTRKEVLEDALNKKNEELKLLCLREGEITGRMPPEMPMAPGEKMPQIRKRIGTAFAIPHFMIDKLKSNDEEAFAKLELDFEIQSKITSAALRLANDTKAKKSVRKARKSSYQQSHTKLKDIERKLNDMRNAMKVVETMRKSAPQHSDDEPSEDNCSQDSCCSDVGDAYYPIVCGDINKTGIGVDANDVMVINYGDRNYVRRPATLTQLMPPPPCVRRCPSPTQSMSSSSSSMIHRAPMSQSAPSSPVKSRRSAPSPVVSDGSSSSPLPQRHHSSGYCPSSVYQTRTTYRSQRFPTFSTRTPSTLSEYDNVDGVNERGATPSPYHSPYRHRFDSTMDESIQRSGQYSIKTQRASQAFDVGDVIENLESDSVSSQGNRDSLVAEHESRGKGDIRRKSVDPGSLDRDDENVQFYNRHVDDVDPAFNQNGVYVAGNVDPSSRSPLTINVASRSDQVNADQSMLQSPRHLPRLRLPVCNVIHNECNYSPNVLNSPRDLGYLRADVVSPASENITPTSPNIIYHQQRRSQKEWYESNLDSPLPARRTNDRLTSPLSDLISTVQQIGDESPPSPHKGDAQSPYSPPLLSPKSPTDCKQVISVGHFKPYHEEIKPYETSDFYKYSTKHRNRSGRCKDGGVEIGNNASASQVLQQVAEDVLTNTVDEGGQYSHPLRPIPTTLPVDHVYNDNGTHKREPHIYEPIDIRHSPVSGSNDAVSPQSVGHYRPLQPMTCEPLSVNSPLLHATSANSSLRRSPMSPQMAANRSGSSAHSGEDSLTLNRASVADAFHDEMLAWYEGQENNSSKKATLV